MKGELFLFLSSAEGTYTFKQKLFIPLLPSDSSLESGWRAFINFTIHHDHDSVQ